MENSIAKFKADIIASAYQCSDKLNVTFNEGSFTITVGNRGDTPPTHKSWKGILIQRAFNDLLDDRIIVGDVGIDSTVYHLTRAGRKMAARLLEPTSAT